MVDVSIIIVSWNTRDLLANCLTSIIQTAADLTFEIIVIDNGSTDGSVEMVQHQFPHIQLVENKANVGFAGANNQGLTLGQGRYLLLLNSDTILMTNSLIQSIHFMDTHLEVGLCGVKLLNPDTTFQASYANFPTLKSEFLNATGLGKRLISPYYPSPRPWPDEVAHKVDWVPGAFMLLRGQVFEQVGGMDPSYWMYSEETDWCYRLKQAGCQIYYLPQVTIIHLGGASTSQQKPKMINQLNQSKVRFFAKNYGFVYAEQLRFMLWVIFLIREQTSRFISLFSSQKDYWHNRASIARLIRKGIENSHLWYSHHTR